MTTQPNRELNDEQIRSLMDGSGDGDIMPEQVRQRAGRQLAALRQKMDEREERAQEKAAAKASRPWLRPAFALRWAAAVALLLIAALAALELMPWGRGNLAFAQVIEQVRRFRPYSFTQVFEPQWGRARTERIKYQSLTLRRQERQDGTINVVDLGSAPVRILTLDPAHKKAELETLAGSRATRDPDLLALMEQMARHPQQDLGRKQIEGRLAQGFQFNDPHNQWTVWADVKTRLPLRVELFHPQPGNKITMTEFRFDERFDPTLFSLTPPAGYALTQKTTPSDLGQPEKSPKTPSPAKAGSTPTSATANAAPFRPRAYTQRVEMGGRTAPPERMLYLTASRRRQESPSGAIAIFDMSSPTVRMLTLDPAKKLATLTTMDGRGPIRDPDLLAMSRQLQNGTEKKLGEKKIGGRPARGFRAELPGNAMEFWLDVQTQLPVEVTITHTNSGRKILLSDFDWNPKLDKALFDTKIPPPGYTLQQ